VHSDEIPVGHVAPEKPDEATKAEWQAFLGGWDWDRGPEKLWIQYTVNE
jgi:hypothetical protein